MFVASRVQRHSGATHAACLPSVILRLGKYSLSVKCFRLVIKHSGGVELYRGWVILTLASRGELGYGMVMDKVYPGDEYA